MKCFTYEAGLHSYQINVYSGGVYFYRDGVRLRANGPADIYAADDDDYYYYYYYYHCYSYLNGK